MSNKRKKVMGGIDFSKFTSEELADAFMFPVEGKMTNEERKEERDFLEQRRKAFLNLSPEQKIYSKLLQLKFHLEDYIKKEDFDEKYNFGYFLREYVERLNKKDKEFADEVGVTPAVLSQYINNHRKPKDEFVIRLELHSNGLLPAIDWFRLIQKDKEHEIITNMALRQKEKKFVKIPFKFAYSQ